MTPEQLEALKEWVRAEIAHRISHLHDSGVWGEYVAVKAAEQALDEAMLGGKEPPKS